MPNAQPGTPPRRRWIAPTLDELPPLTQLTLQTGIPPMINPGFSVRASAANAINRVNGGD